MNDLPRFFKASAEVSYTAESEFCILASSIEEAKKWLDENVEVEDVTGVYFDQNEFSLSIYGLKEVEEPTEEFALSAGAKAFFTDLGVGQDIYEGFIDSIDADRVIEILAEAEEAMNVPGTAYYKKILENQGQQRLFG